VIGVVSTFEITIAFEKASSQILKPRRRAAGENGEAQRALAGKKVLIVEDSLDNQLLAKEFLTKEGAEVEIAGNGLEAVNAVLLASYDLILMDMQMPVMDGYAATAQLRRLGFHTPIIALTAHAMKDDLEKCLNAGCDDYLCKPFRRGNLIALIEQHCQSAA
jgi:CheY-like chemotaxis protein